MDELSVIEKEILKLRQEEGLSIDKILVKLHISRKTYTNIISKLTDLDLYNEEKAKKAMKKQKDKKRRAENKKTPPLSPKEEEYRKKCIDLLSVKYFDYNRIKKINPVLITKLKQLHDICSYQIIFNTINLQEMSLKYALTKEFSSEFGKINYIIAIIKNNLSEVKEKMIIQQKIRQGIEKRTDDDTLVNELNKNRTTAHTTRIDMSQWLDD